jgi:glucosamine-6-phosphate deaminase
MRIVILKSAEAACTAVAHLLADVLRVTPDAVLALPTGQTPVLLYRALAALHAGGRVDFSRATAFNLDEYVGVESRDPRSFRAFMEAHLFSKINLPAGRRHFPDSARGASRRQADRFERQIADAGGLDVVILGIGRNGHIGFNEPADALQARTHEATLTRETRRVNAALAGGRWQRVPARAMTMGVGTIMKGRSIVLLATGPSKARIVRTALTGPITTRVPASLLQAHPNVTVVLDRAAARELPATRARRRAPN